MTYWICRTCGVEQRPAEQPPQACPICSDERQYVLPSGPAWTSSSELVDAGHTLEVVEVEPGLWGFKPDPKVGIGQTALLATGPGGNLLFDVPAFVTVEAVAAMNERGGVAAIMASHPHMYGSQVAWSHALGGIPVHVAEKDLEWVQRTDEVITTWNDTFEVVPGVTAAQVGGHFRGQTIAHWTGADGKGVMFTGDACQTRADGNVTFLRSYPNSIPLSPKGVTRIADTFAGFDYDRLYDNLGGTLPRGAKRIVQFSADRYIAWITGEHDDLI